MTLSSVTAGSRLRASTVNTWIDEINNLGLDLVEVVKSGDTTRISTATLAADPHLTIALLASTTYIFDADLYSNSGTTPDIQYAMAFPTGSAVTWGGIRLVTAASPTGDGDYGVYIAPTSAVSSIGAAGTGGDQLTKIAGTIVTSTTPGNLVVWWAQNTNTASNTILRARSALKARRVR